MATTQAVATTDDKKVALFQNELSAMRTQIEKVIPSMVDPKQMMISIYRAVQANPSLMETTAESRKDAIMSIAQTGLLPNTPLGYASLIKYGSKCTYQIQYQGQIELVMRSGQVRSIFAQVIHENDRVIKLIEGTRFQVEVERAWKDAGELRAVYALAEMNDGTIRGVLMTEDEVKKVRGASAQYKSNPNESLWTKWPEEMWKKTAIKRLCKMLPRSIEISKVIEEDIDEAPKSLMQEVNELADAAKHTVGVRKMVEEGVIVNKEETKEESKEEKLAKKIEKASEEGLPVSFDELFE